MGWGWGPAAVTQYPPPPPPAPLYLTLSRLSSLHWTLPHTTPQPRYYDSYSPPMTTFYSQVWWSPLAPTPMPPAMVKKYAGKAMAIVGWEIDQVRRTPDGDVSVPISATYNHHYTAQVIGAKAQFRKVMLSGPEDKYAAEVEAQSHGHVAWDQPHYVVEELEKPSNGGATSQAFSSANGGEYTRYTAWGVEVVACRCDVM